MVEGEATRGVCAPGRTDGHSVRAACASDVGRERHQNEDRCLVAAERDLFIVSDGMGGHQAGEVASQVVVSILPTLIRRQLAGVTSLRSRLAELILREAILDLGRRLRAETAGQPGLRGLGATVALVWLCEAGVAHLAHMGDSRIYLVRQGQLVQLTEDHSVVALLLRDGDITPDEARSHPARGQLSRYVGMEGEAYADVQTIQLQGGDRLLLCSDGLTRPLSDGHIAELLATCGEPEAACQALVAAANAAGGPDNITALVVDFG